MRLINAETLDMEEFTDEEVVEYAILSHRWGIEEVSFQDMRHPDIRAAKAGFAKIDRGRMQAAANGLRYFWCDTCCINRDNLVELAEAINSMFRWYRNSKICFVFLGDIELANRSEDMSLTGDSIKHSEWFQRGWTLQELIAPQQMAFYDRNWTYLGSRVTLGQVIHERTGIPEQVLSSGSFEEYSIAQRMSWASNRVTTRPEDIAYCLLGLFGISMPMLYGEGRKAFIRLQEQIIQETDDESIFAWEIEPSSGPDGSKGPAAPFSGLFADSPAAFATCSNVVEATTRARHSHRKTNRGLSITLNVRPLTTDTYLALLNCLWTEQLALPRRVLYVGLYLQRRSKNDDGQFVRVTYKGQSRVVLSIPYERDMNDRLYRRNFEPREVHVRQNRPSDERMAADVFRVTMINWKDPGYSGLFPWSDIQPYVWMRFDLASFPFRYLRLFLDHDLRLVCVLCLRDRQLVKSRCDTLQVCHLKGFDAAPSSNNIVRVSSSEWKLQGLHEEFELHEPDTFALKGDEHGFDVQFTPFFDLIAARRWDEEARGTHWHLKISLWGIPDHTRASTQLEYFNQKILSNTAADWQSN